ncbi:glycosyltransferase family 4 protein [Sphaerospermopsis aphanizomenoides BCCUSP55]|uniref:glycosyltransferase family 4 protein n=1 Tax=Sphaerospermopsis aphanizomenoides TaxID=459663 RepID=UPI00190429B9|nr:glycosyltransferase family 4 protein [Sphaerospermopsis aphanizomenoides]MBK1987117.1 glycosyltransferase family 4 protein [Sphaerospermopsis aphanizomenoides BCCUSP55]
MRILFISSSSGSRGGGELYLIYLGKELSKRGYAVGLWCSQHPIMDELAKSFAEFGEVLRSPYLNTYNRKLRSFTHLFPKISQECISQWQAFKPDIIHLNKQNLEDGLDLLAWSNYLSVPSLVTIHITQTQDSLGAVFGTWRDIIAKITIKKYRGSLVAISENRGKELTSFLAPINPSLPKIVVINNGVNVPQETERLAKRQEYRLQLKLNPEELLIVAVGRMEAQKQPLLFLEWATHLKRNIPSARFLWVGDGRLTSIWDQWVIDNNAQNYIQRLGWQNDVTPYLAAADGFFHPAAFEGLPFALLEAMAWSLPCVITSTLADELKFPQGVCFIVSEKNNFQELDNLSNFHKRNAVATAGNQLIKERFSLEKMVDTYTELYSNTKLLNQTEQ